MHSPIGVYLIMEYKGFEYTPENVYNFSNLQYQEESSIGSEPLPVVTGGMANTAAYTAYDSFSQWLDPLLSPLRLNNAEWAPRLWSCLSSGDKVDVVLAEMDMTCDEDYIQQLALSITEYYQYLIYESPEAGEFYQKAHNGDVPYGGEELESTSRGHHSSDPTGADVTTLGEDLEGDLGDPFELLEKAFELDQYSYNDQSVTDATAFSTAAKWQALEATSWNVSRSWDLLQSTLRKVNSSRPCRHALQGGCYRKDCWFDHDFAVVPCRYWLLGYQGCTATDQCPFQHHFETPSLDTSDIADIGSVGNPEIATNDTCAFPDLSGTSTQKGDSIKGTIHPNLGLLKSYKAVVGSNRSFRPPSTIHTATSSKTSNHPKSTLEEKGVKNTFNIDEWVESGVVWYFWLALYKLTFLSYFAK